MDILGNVMSQSLIYFNEALVERGKKPVDEAGMNKILNRRFAYQAPEIECFRSEDV